MMAGIPPAGTAGSLGSTGISTLAVTVTAGGAEEEWRLPKVWSSEWSRGDERGDVVLVPGSLANDLRASGGHNYTLTYLDLVSL